MSTKGVPHSKKHNKNVSKALLSSDKLKKTHASKEYKLKQRLAHLGKKSSRWNGGEEKSAERKKNSKIEKQEKLAGRMKPVQCEICGGMGRICFDHDHTISEKQSKESFRGFICQRCNHVLGLTKDSPELLRRLAKYLETTQNPSSK